MARILALRAHARVPPDPELELGRARREASRGDADWAQWLEDYASGRALVLALDVELLYEDDDGALGSVEAHNRDVWVETHADPPQVAEQVRLAASKDYDRLSDALLERGIDLAPGALDHMYVEVTLDRTLVDELVAVEPLLCERPPRRRLGDLAG